MRKLALVVFLTSLFAFDSAFAMRCNHKIIRVGDRKFEVLHICGEPDYVEVRYLNEGTRLRNPNRTLEISRLEEIVIEEWTYNFGSTKLMRLLLFENGVLKKIRSMGYGY